jgi:CAAX protease family protein
VALSEWRDIWCRFQGRGTYPHQLAFLLLNPLRRFILSPQELVERLHLSERSRVLELGPGPGYFSAHVARSVSRGHLYLVDIQRQMLEKARLRIRRAGLTNVSFAQASASALPFMRDVFDVAFLVAVLGEVPDPRKCLECIRYSLRPGGILSVTEVAGDPDAISPSEVSAIANSAGFEALETFQRRGAITMNFRRPLEIDE